VFQANLKPNQSFPMMSSEINLEDIAMVILGEVPEDARKAFEKHRMAVEECRRATKAKELQEYLARFRKDQQDVVTQDKQVILPPLDNMTMVTRNVSTSSPSVTREVLSNMLVDHNKTMMSQMQQTMEESIDKFFRKLNISSNSPVAHMNRHASNSLATHVPL
jgi:5'-3' exonuclease